MRGLKVPFQQAEIVKKYLLERNLLDKRYAPTSHADGIVFPIVREFGPPWDFDVDFIETEVEERVQARSLKAELGGVLPEEELALLVTSFDTIGSIAIIEIPEELAHRAQVIGETLLAVNKNITTVLKKAGGRQGTFRTQPLEHVAGNETRETTVVENGARLKVNVEDAYYSPRMSTERKRIVEMIRPGEDVLCLFSGVGPYPVIFSRHSRAERILGVEINPAAHELAMENAARNRCTNVRLLCGDAHDIVPRLAAREDRFDRITMPLPGNAREFLDDALSVSKKGTVIHYYTFKEEGSFEDAVTELQNAFGRKGFSLGSWEIVKAGQHAPRIWRICVDAVVG